MTRAGGPRRAIVLNLLLAGVACVLVSPGSLVSTARAEDPPAVLDAPTLLERLQAARRAGEVRAIEQLVKAAAEAHNRCRSASTRTRLRAQLGELVRDESAGGNRLHAVDALARLDDAQNAWRELRRSVPDPAADTVDATGRRVLRALGLLAYDPSLDPLRRMAREGRDPEAVALSVEAIGRFRFSRYRADLLGDLFAVGQDTASSPQRGTARDDATRQSWLRVVSEVVKAMDHLTGRRVGTLERWSVLLDQYRGRYEKLFEEDDR